MSPHLRTTQLAVSAFDLAEYRVKSAVLDCPLWLLLALISRARWFRLALVLLLLSTDTEKYLLPSYRVADQHPSLVKLARRRRALLLVKTQGLLSASSEARECARENKFFTIAIETAGLIDFVAPHRFSPDFSHYTLFSCYF